MSLLKPKSVILYCQRYNDRFYERVQDQWRLYMDLCSIYDEMIENGTLLTAEQAKDIAVRIWTFAKQVARNHDGAGDALLERMCMSAINTGIFDDEEKRRVREMAELVSYLDGGRGAMQLDHINRLLALMTQTVVDALERESPGFFTPERVLADYCKKHLDSHNDESRAKMGWNELDDILANRRWLSEEQAIGFAIESWRISQDVLHANVDELEEIATQPVFITDWYISQGDVQRLMEPADELLYLIRFGADRERCSRFLALSMKVCADSLLLTCPEMFDAKDAR